MWRRRTPNPVGTGIASFRSRYTLGGWLHLLLIGAIVALLIRLIQGRPV
jgi:uncharacterized protein DUF5670